MRIIIFILIYLGCFGFFAWWWHKKDPQAYHAGEPLSLTNQHSLTGGEKLGAVAITTLMFSVIWVNDYDNIFLMLVKFFIILLVSIIFWVLI